MYFAKFTAYDGSPVYVNPMNINRIYESELTGTLTCIDMIGDGNEQGTFFKVLNTFKNLAEHIENYIEISKE